MVLIGKFPRFYFGENDFDVYQTQLEYFLEQNNVPKSKWRDALIVSMAGSIYLVLRDKCHPQLPTDKTYDELIVFLRNQYVFRKPVHRERVKFYSARQNADQTIDAWYSHVRMLAMDCNFGNRLNSVILDRFISGLRDKDTLERLFEEDDSMTIERAVEISTLLESASSSDNK